MNYTEKEIDNFIVVTFNPDEVDIHTVAEIYQNFTKAYPDKEICIVPKGIEVSIHDPRETYNILINMANKIKDKYFIGDESVDDGR